MSFIPLTFQDLEQTERGSVWILNSAKDSEFDFEGELLIDIPTAQGKSDLMKVPNSWLPFEVTARFPKQRILDSSQFRSCVGRGIITLISEADARAMLNEPGAKEERERLRALEAHVKKAGAPGSISEANVTITNPNELQRGNGVPVETYGGNDDVERSRQIAASRGQALDENGLKPNFVTFFNKIKTMTDVQAMNAYRNKGSLSRRELRWLRDNLPHHPQTVKMIKSRLVELKKAAAAQRG